MPSAPGRSHRRHGSEQVCEQHTPSTQCSEAHSQSSVHPAPRLRCAPQLPPSHTFVPAHIPESVHSPGHSPPTHTYGAQFVMPRSAHRPLPLQLPPFSSTDGMVALHCGAAHTRSPPGYAHRPPSSHRAPHRPLPPHIPRESCPAGTLVQRPRAHASAQLRQVPGHASSQHTPSTQYPDRHSPAPVQGSPSTKSPLHTPPAQLPPSVQSASVAHEVGHSASFPSHTYRPHPGRPSDPAGAVAQLPSFPPTAHDWHGNGQACRQHTPSTQPPPVAHTRHPETRQSPPAAALQAAPGAFSGWHVPSAPQ
jgi:hypothetical protein